MGTCTFKGCSKPEMATGLCGGHHRQKCRGLQLVPLNSHRNASKCLVEGCPKTPTAKSYCKSHYVYKRATTYAEDDDNCCNFDGCKLITYAKGFCMAHYWAFKSFSAFPEALTCDKEQTS